MRLSIKHIMHVDVETRLLSNKVGNKPVSKKFLSSDNICVLLESRTNAFHCPRYYVAAPEHINYLYIKIKFNNFSFLLK
jgi:hypothetical protein